MPLAEPLSEDDPASVDSPLEAPEPEDPVFETTPLEEPDSEELVPEELVPDESTLAVSPLALLVPEEPLSVTTPPDAPMSDEGELGLPPQPTLRGTHAKAVKKGNAPTILFITCDTLRNERAGKCNVRHCSDFVVSAPFCRDGGAFCR
jgi:hypothetical protein